MTFDVEKSVGFLLAKAHQHVVALFKEEFAAYEITPTQFILLAILWEMGSAPQAELSEKSHIDRTTIVGIVDRLAKRKLVERKAHPDDRRIHLITLTVRGRELEEELRIAASRVREKIKAKISPGDCKTLVCLLKRLHCG